jgi:cell division cycle 14
MRLLSTVTPSVTWVLPDRFMFSVGRPLLQQSASDFSFTVEGDHRFAYEPFLTDFGPLSLPQIHAFVALVLSHIQAHPGVLQLYSSGTPDLLANAVLLAAAFRLVHLGTTPDEALRPLTPLLARVPPFRDASTFQSTHDLTLAACVHGLARAVALGWYRFAAFDPAPWLRRERVEHGDMNWVVPGKLLAFAAPYPTNSFQGHAVCTPADLVPVFRELRITTVVRLNNRTYDEGVFTAAGFAHRELFFADGSCPPDAVLEQFLELIEGDAVVALHCKAGLGRTYS